MGIWYSWLTHDICTVESPVRARISPPKIFKRALPVSWLAGPGSFKKIEMEKIKIALIAHDGMKADMVSFVTKRLDFFNQEDVEICATGTTGKYIKFAGIEKVQSLLSGPKGGDAQIAAMVALEEIDAVIFFRDPLDAHPHETDIQMLMRVCDVHVVPLATNYMSAKLLIDWFRSAENIAYWKKRKTED